VYSGSFVARRLSTARDETKLRSALASGEGANLVCLELFDGESSDSSAVEATARIGGLLKQARHGVPSETLDPSDRGHAGALDSESDDRSKPALRCWKR